MNKLQIKLYTDAVDNGGGGSNQAEEVDPLAGAAAGWEAPKFPCLMPDRLYRMKIVKATKDQVKGDATRELLTIVLKTEQDYTDEEGKPLRAGFTGYHRIGVSASPATETRRARTLKDVGAELAMVLKTAGLKDTTPRDLLNNPALLEGILVDIKVGIQKEKDGYPRSNTYKFIPPA